MSDNKNLLLAILLSAIILLVWNLLYELPKSKIEQENLATQQKLSQDEGQSLATEDAELFDTENIADNVVEEEDTSLNRDKALSETQRVIINTSSLSGSISLEGAAIDDITLNNFHTAVEKESPNIVLLSPQKTESPYYARTSWWPHTNNQKMVSVPMSDSTWKVVGNQTLTTTNPVNLEWDNGEGIIFKKQIAIDDAYMFKIQDSVTNNTSIPITLYPYGRIVREKAPPVLGFFILHEGFLGLFGEGDDVGIKEKDYDDIKEEEYEEKKINGGWLGITDKYWLTALIPPKNVYNAKFSYKNKYIAHYQSAELTIKPQQTENVESYFFAGAKEIDALDFYATKYNINRFDFAVDWGWLKFLTEPLFYFVRYLDNLCGNFGYAIVLMTVALRLVLFPLANYSFKSMARMKKLQPEMKRIRDKYKEDRAKQQQELMALYKKEKVNPMSGCLPILLQIPIFFAVYKMLFVSIEMRHAPFIGWIKDLSAADPTSIFNLFGLIPWDPPSFLMIGLWPIFMGLSMYVTQKLNPTPPDPIQAKIFMVFPFFITILLASFPAGLVIYWTTNNVLSALQQWVIVRKTTVRTK